MCLLRPWSFEHQYGKTWRIKRGRGQSSNPVWHIWPVPSLYGTSLSSHEWKTRRSIIWKKWKFFSSSFFLWERLQQWNSLWAGIQCESYHSMVPRPSARANKAGSRLRIKQTHLSHGESRIEEACYYFKTFPKSVNCRSAKCRQYNLAFSSCIYLLCCELETLHFWWTICFKQVIYYFTNLLAANFLQLDYDARKTMTKTHCKIGQSSLVLFLISVMVHLSALMVYVPNWSEFKSLSTLIWVRP